MTASPPNLNVPSAPSRYPPVALAVGRRRIGGGPGELDVGVVAAGRRGRGAAAGIDATHLLSALKRKEKGRLGFR